MKNVYIAKGASLHQINRLAETIRASAFDSSEGEIDIIRYLEIDLPKIFPGLYLFIEDDVTMGARRAFISEDPLGIVVSESIYEAAAQKSAFATEVLLHEVGHLFLHHRYAALGLNNADAVYRDRIKDTPLPNSAEWQATAFALCFLYPYSFCKRYKTAIEIKKAYKLTERQAIRIHKHLGRLKMRQDQTSLSKEGNWIKTVISDLPPKKAIERTADPVGQFSLFFSGRRPENNLLDA
ncbi:ImmA/IrrE family metallo-endopeptidase [Mesorhizobium carmichaelinearum]|uniref:ImmA/IrrE family metallo-endopeptidase n=1 Tax=Mesorhizobium carmichaelinearum TaxID=1208188 RepID=UPI000BA427F0|nr:hypothetical protein [Mesorhizobium carmichaelinearum]